MRRWGAQPARIRENKTNVVPVRLVIQTKGADYAHRSREKGLVCPKNKLAVNKGPPLQGSGPGSRREALGLRWELDANRN